MTASLHMRKYSRMSLHVYTLLQTLQHLRFPSFEDRSCMHTRLSTAMGRSKIAQLQKKTTKANSPSKKTAYIIFLITSKIALYSLRFRQSITLLK